MRTVERFPHEVEIIEHVWIPLPDGQRLAARLWIPQSARNEPAPAILEYIPYRKRDLTRRRDSTVMGWLSGMGFACVRVDLRGSGESDGLLLDEYLEQEILDGCTAIEWISEQPWCNGRVGMMGISWGGFNALQIAARRPPGLGAIITACSSDDTYLDNIHYMGGCLLTDNISEATTMFAHTTLPPDPALLGEAWRDEWMHRLREGSAWSDRWLRQQLWDDRWAHSSVATNYDAIDVPVMAVSGWADGFTNAVFRLMENLSVPRLGIVGPWSHKWPHQGVPGPAIGFLQEAKRWFDHWLCGEETGIMAEPRLRIWMQDAVPPMSAYDERPGRWVGENAWPSSRITERRWPMANRVLLQPGEEGAPAVRTLCSPLSVGLFAGKWCSYVAPPDLPGDQREEDGGSLCFDSDPLSEDLEVLGVPRVELELESDRPVAQVVVRLSDVLLDGSITRVSYGLLNLTHRDSHAEPTPLNPGERCRVTVELNAVAQTFRTGHRIRVAVSTSYWPLVWPTPHPAMLTLHTRGSAVRLPVRPPREQDDEIGFLHPEGAAVCPSTLIAPAEPSWKVLRDLGTDTATLQVVRHDERIRYDEISLEWRRRTHEHYTVGLRDWSSTVAETWTERMVSRGDWSVRVETRTHVSCDVDDFHLRVELDAWEGAARVYSDNERWRIPRQLV